MPLVNVKVIEGVFTSPQKQEMIRKLTDAMIAVGGEKLRPFVYGVVVDVKSREWGIGGKPITSEHVQEVLAGKGT
jgi:4-oxalocrotonate tautomerase